MRKLISILTVATVLSPSVALAMPMAEADTLTGRSVTDDFTSGKLDTRLNDLGTNYQTKEFMPIWYKTQLDGIRLHCARTLHSRKAFSEKCGTSVAYKSVK